MIGSERNRRAKRSERLNQRIKIFGTIFLLCCTTAFMSSRIFKKEESPIFNINQKTADDTVVESNTTVIASVCAEPELDCASDQPSTVLEATVWVVMYIIATLYVFLGLAVVCDDFFVSSLEVICDELDLSPDVAGATFMAAGSSAPELFTSVVGVFYAKNDVGVGTILGSAVFNILVIIGLTGVFAGQILDLDWRPLARDSVFYFASIILILVMFNDRKIDWFESAFLLGAYAVYLICMKYNPSLMKFMDRLVRGNTVKPLKEKTPAPSNTTNLGLSDGRDKPPTFRVIGKVILAQIRFQKAGEQQKKRRENARAHAVQKKKEMEDPDEAFEFPTEASASEQLYWIIGLPYRILFKFTIPDCSEEKFRKYYLVTFSMSVFWIAVLCFFMVDWSRSLGCILNIDPAVMGLTLLAAGTSVPDAMASLLVAQDGEGDMAVSNAIGSNVFDILIGLGAPWVLSAIISKGAPIDVCSDGITLAVLILVGILGFVIGVLALSGWKLSPKAGGAMFCMYFAFLIYSILDAYLHFTR